MPNDPLHRFEERPWTPGPWRRVNNGWDPSQLVSDNTPSGNTWHVVDFTEANRADAELIRLAPEMAEAILEYQECGPYKKLYEVAQKLRGIEE